MDDPSSNQWGLRTCGRIAGCMCSNVFWKPTHRTNGSTTRQMDSQEMHQLELSQNGTSRVTKKVGETDWLSQVHFGSSTIIVMLGTKPVTAGHVCSKTPILLELLKDSTSTTDGLRCMVGEPHICTHFHGHVRNRRQCRTTAQKAEVMSLDTGLRMEGLLALTLWDIVIDVSEPPASRARGGATRQLRTQIFQTTQETIDNVPPNAQESSQSCSFVLFWKDKEAVRKVNNQGQDLSTPSPLSLRHVPRTHRVNLDWLMKESVWIRTSQLKHIHTNQQIADILTDGLHAW